MHPAVCAACVASVGGCSIVDDTHATKLPSLSPCLQELGTPIATTTVGSAATTAVGSAATTASTHLVALVGAALLNHVLDDIVAVLVLRQLDSRLQGEGRGAEQGRWRHTAHSKGVGECRPPAT